MKTLLILIMMLSIFSCRKQIEISHDSFFQDTDSLTLQDFMDRHIDIITKMDGRVLRHQIDSDKTIFYLINENNLLELYDIKGNLQNQYDLEGILISDEDPGKGEIRGIGLLRETEDNKLIIVSGMTPAKILHFDIKGKEKDIKSLKFLEEYVFSRDVLFWVIGFYDDNSLISFPMGDDPEKTKSFIIYDIYSNKIKKGEALSYNDPKYRNYYNAKMYFENIISSRHIIKRSSGFYDILFYNLDTGELDFVFDRPGFHSALHDASTQPQKTVNAKYNLSYFIFSCEDLLYLPYFYFANDLMSTHFLNPDVITSTREGKYQSYVVIDIWNMDKKKLIKEIRFPFDIILSRSEDSGKIELYKHNRTYDIIFLSSEYIHILYDDNTTLIGRFRTPLHEIDDSDFVYDINERDYKVIFPD